MRKLNAANQHPMGSQHNGLIPLSPLPPPSYPHPPPSNPYPPPLRFFPIWIVSTCCARWLQKSHILSRELPWWSWHFMQPPRSMSSDITVAASLPIPLWSVRTHGASWLCRGVLLPLESLWWWGKSLRTAAPCGLTAPLSHPYASQPCWCWLATWECSFSGVTLKMKKPSVAISTLWPTSSLVSSLFLPMRPVSTHGVSWLHGSVLLSCGSP